MNLGSYMEEGTPYYKRGADVHPYDPERLTRARTLHVAQLSSFKLAFRDKGKLYWAPTMRAWEPFDGGVNFVTKAVWLAAPISITELAVIDDQGFVVQKTPHSLELPVGSILRLKCTLLYD